MPDLNRDNLCKDTDLIHSKQLCKMQNVRRFCFEDENAFDDCVIWIFKKMEKPGMDN